MIDWIVMQCKKKNEKEPITHLSFVCYTHHFVLILTPPPPPPLFKKKTFNKYFCFIDLGYLSVLRPALGWVIWTAAGFGTLGLSTQLCLIQDIISMLTLHIYCFYVYAARQEFHTFIFSFLENRNY